MNFKTIENYSQSILELYKENRGGDMAAFLSNPSPALIRDACLELYKKDLIKSDEEIIRSFFKFREGENGETAIEEHGVGKLRAISDFLIEKSNTKHTPRLNLIALLVDFQPRPYSKFRKNKGEVVKDDSKTDNTQQLDNNAIGTGENHVETGEGKEGGKPWKKIIITISFIGIAAIIYFIPDWEQNDCMIWSNDHYEKIACDKTSNPNLFYNQNIVENFKRVELDTTTEVFFKDGKALYWYDKEDGKIEFFTKGGKHPVNNKVLKPVTQTIIRKYVYGEK